MQSKTQAIRAVNMTPKQFRAAIAALGMSQGAAAEFFGVTIRTAHAWANEAPIPEAVAKLLRVMIERHIMPVELED